MTKPAPQTEVAISILTSLDQIPAVDWDSCACPEAAGDGRPLDPFTTHRFLSALENSGSVGPGTGWQPRHLAVYIDDRIVAAAPMYVKSHSQGEYIFDHNWAHAYENAGGHYYPKFQMAVPFTPVTGRRFLVRPGFEGIGESALVQGAVQIGADNDVSSLHITFCTPDEARAGEAMGLLTRTSQQFHWENAGYADFDAFLAALSSRKRKNIRKERAAAQAFGGTIRTLTGDQIKPHHWDDVWVFYQDTGARKWGSPYLTRQFFEIAHETMRDDILLILAERGGQCVAGALNFIGRDRLFGRYWGCVEDHACLHFELCYYQAIEYAIRNGLMAVEAGAQGAHKLARGYLPVATHSLHWIRDEGFSDAIARYLQAERDAVDEEISVMTEYGPFRKPRIEDHQ